MELIYYNCNRPNKIHIYNKKLSIGRGGAHFSIRKQTRKLHLSKQNCGNIALHLLYSEIHNGLGQNHTVSEIRFPLIKVNDPMFSHTSYRILYPGPFHMFYIFYVTVWWKANGQQFAGCLMENCWQTKWRAKSLLCIDWQSLAKLKPRTVLAMLYI